MNRTRRPHEERPEFAGRILTSTQQLSNTERRACWRTRKSWLRYAAQVDREFGV